MKSLRVVLAEDETLIRMDLVEMFTDAGHVVLGHAATGDAAVNLVREHQPDLAVFDVNMPGLDGIAAAEILAEENLAPVVLLTAFSDNDLVLRAASAGVLAYVVKPFTWDDLAPSLTVALARWQEQQTARKQLSDLSEKLETRTLLDRAKSMLQQEMGVDEATAFRWIQKTAMDRRKSMKEVCEFVLEQMSGPAAE